MDPYQILGVSKTASDKEIADAYRRLARKYHPDLNKDNPEAEEKMKEINAAYGRIQDMRAGKIPPSGQGFAEANTPPYGQNPYGAGSYGPYGSGQGGYGTGSYGPYGYGPFGPFGPYRTYRTVRRVRPFSILRFFLTLMLLSFLMRACAFLSFQFSYYPTESPPPYQQSEPQVTRPSGEI